MAITAIQANGNTNNSATSIAAVLTSNTTFGNLLVVYGTSNSPVSTPTLTISDNQGNTYTLQASVAYGAAGNTSRITCWTAPITSAGSTTVTVFTDQTASAMALAVCEYHSSLGALTYDHNATASGTITSSGAIGGTSLPTFSPSFAVELVTACLAQTPLALTYTGPGVPWNLEYDNSASLPTVGISLYDDVTATSGTAAPQWTETLSLGTQYWASIYLTISEPGTQLFDGIGTDHTSMRKFGSQASGSSPFPGLLAETAALNRSVNRWNQLGVATPAPSFPELSVANFGMQAEPPRPHSGGWVESTVPIILQILDIQSPCESPYSQVEVQRPDPGGMLSVHGTVPLGVIFPIFYPVIGSTESVKPHVGGWMYSFAPWYSLPVLPENIMQVSTEWQRPEEGKRVYFVSRAEIPTNPNQVFVATGGFMRPDDGSVKSVSKYGLQSLLGSTVYVAKQPTEVVQAPVGGSLYKIYTAQIPGFPVYGLGLQVEPIRPYPGQAKTTGSPILQLPAFPPMMVKSEPPRLDIGAVISVRQMFFSFNTALDVLAVSEFQRPESGTAFSLTGLLEGNKLSPSIINTPSRPQQGIDVYQGSANTLTGLKASGTARPVAYTHLVLADAPNPYGGLAYYTPSMPVNAVVWAGRILSFTESQKPDSGKAVYPVGGGVNAVIWASKTVAFTEPPRWNIGVGNSYTIPLFTNTISPGASLTPGKGERPPPHSGSSYASFTLPLMGFFAEPRSAIQASKTDVMPPYSGGVFAFSGIYATGPWVVGKPTFVGSEPPKPYPGGATSVIGLLASNRVFPGQVALISAVSPPNHPGLAASLTGLLEGNTLLPGRVVQASTAELIPFSGAVSVWGAIGNVVNPGKPLLVSKMDVLPHPGMWFGSPSPLVPYLYYPARPVLVVKADTPSPFGGLANILTGILYANPVIPAVADVTSKVEVSPAAGIAVSASSWLAGNARTPLVKTYYGRAEEAKPYPGGVSGQANQIVTSPVGYGRMTIAVKADVLPAAGIANTLSGLLGANFISPGRSVVAVKSDIHSPTAGGVFTLSGLLSSNQIVPARPSVISKVDLPNVFPGVVLIQCDTRLILQPLPKPVLVSITQPITLGDGAAFSWLVTLALPNPMPVKGLNLTARTEEPPSYSGWVVLYSSGFVTAVPMQVWYGPVLTLAARSYQMGAIRAKVISG